MLSAFGVEHGEVSKLFGRYYHATQEPLELGTKLISGRAQKLEDVHPEGEAWRNGKVWMTRRKSDARKWGGAGSKAYRVKPSKDVVRHKPNDYDRKFFEKTPTGRLGLGTATKRQKKAKGQYHASDAVVTKMPGERGPTPKKIILGTGGVAGGAGAGAVAVKRKRRSS